jgi:hypothetical protein
MFSKRKPTSGYRFHSDSIETNLDKLAHSNDKTDAESNGEAISYVVLNPTAIKHPPFNATYIYD